MARDRDLYRRLGLKRDASPQDVHRAYRRAARDCHPDVVGGSAESWGALVEAYDVLRAHAPSPRHIVPGHDPLVMKYYPAASKDLDGIAVRLDAARLRET